MAKITDQQLADAFFKRLQERGFELKINRELYSDENSVVYQLLNAEKDTFCEFDFHADGSFYRIAGFTSGFWQDEVDWNKY